MLGITYYSGEQHCLVNLKMKRFILWVTVTVRSETNDCFMCMISEINNLSKEVKVRFMRKSGPYFLQSEMLEKWFPKSAIFHRCSIPSINSSMPSILNVYVIK